MHPQLMRHTQKHTAALCLVRHETNLLSANLSAWSGGTCPCPSAEQTLHGCRTILPCNPSITLHAARACHAPAACMVRMLQWLGFPLGFSSPGFGSWKPTRLATASTIFLERSSSSKPMLYVRSNSCGITTHVQLHHRIWKPKHVSSLAQLNPTL